VTNVHKTINGRVTTEQVKLVFFHCPLFFSLTLALECYIYYNVLGFKSWYNLFCIYFPSSFCIIFESRSSDNRYDLSAIKCTQSACFPSYIVTFLPFYQTNKK